MNKKYTIAVGDIHGHYNPLIELQKAIHEKYDFKDIQWIFLGDYVDRGPDSKKVLNLMKSNNDWIKIKGNHEDMMAKQLNIWFSNGGVQTLESYGLKNFLYASKNHVPYYQQDEWKDVLEDAKWVDSLPTMYEDEFRIYVHAGLFPSDNWKKDSSDDVKMWIREEFLRFPFDFGKLVVHGHTPYHYKGEIQKTPYRLNLDTASCFGGHLTAAVFTNKQRDPIEYFHVGNLE